MMDGTVGAMMGGMMGLGWIAALALVILVIAGVVWLVHSLARAPGHADGAAGTLRQRLCLECGPSLGPSHSSGCCA